jgi:uncharacterized integral membrane protein
MRWKLFFGIVLLILVVIFTLQNTAVVHIRFLAWEFAVSRALLLFLVLAIGIVIGWATSTISERRHARKHATADDAAAEPPRARAAGSSEPDAAHRD